MAEEQSTEERLATLENKVAELERQRSVQEEQDIALLARVDGFVHDLHRIERVQLRGFEELQAGLQLLLAGQERILAILNRTAKMND